MDDFEGHRAPVSDAEADGLPETTDPDSHADEALDDVRIVDGPTPVPLPPDREDGPLGLDEYGTSAAERDRREPLSRKLRRERPDLDADAVALLAGPGWDEETPDQQAARRPDEDAESLDSGGAIDPHLDWHTSMYDRAVPGIPTLGRIGRLVWPDAAGLAAGDPTLGAYDAGSAGGGFTAEEAAMHEIPESELGGGPEPGEEAGAASGRREGRREGRPEPVIRTGADQPWDPEDLAVAEGHDPTPAHVRHAKEELERLGPAAIEKTVP
jgi:uncharacterized protein DUF5709